MVPSRSGGHRFHRAPSDVARRARRRRGVQPGDALRSEALAEEGELRAGAAAYGDEI